MFALAAALCLAGTLYGRHFKDESGQRTNLFLMGVGFTSCGKDHALKAVSRALDSCEATNLRLGQVTSDSAVEYALRRSRRSRRGTRTTPAVSCGTSWATSSAP
jgi:hypothetical protein